MASVLPCCERDHNRDGNCDRHPRGRRVPAILPVEAPPQLKGVWRCAECGEIPGLDSRWRWNGEAWEHHHGYPVGHVRADYFATDGRVPVEAPRATQEEEQEAVQTRVDGER
jgi:hypothetical protein